MKKINNLECVINEYRKEFPDCYIWFNENLVSFKIFHDAYKAMDIYSIVEHNEGQTFFILEENGVYHIVSVKNPDEEY